MKKLLLLLLFPILTACPSSKNDPAPQSIDLAGTKWVLDDHYSTSYPKWTKASNANYTAEWIIGTNEIQVSEVGKSGPYSYTIGYTRLESIITINPANPNLSYQFRITSLTGRRLELQTIVSANAEDAGFRFNRKD